ncbi:putative zinc finger mynd-type protein [Rosellinia necatrix]|uniref:Putative zinc finger mynd-type protein n=1 Tax=Rosellinia necatrix TaxID=77044 RepID=A0A1W2TQE6_ROSNE|nr:putative zinc finger mynd-type protein [Rosellinia necatrix]
MKKRPTKEHLRAFLFPVGQKQPKLIWLHCEWQEPEDEDETRWQLANAKPFLNNNHGHEVPIQYNEVLTRRLLNTVCVSYRDSFLVDGSAPNSSVAAITATSPGYHHDWRGPIIGYGKVGTGVDPERCRDVDMNDFRHIADYFVAYGSDRMSTPPTSSAASGRGRPGTKGVRINCLGDQKLFNRPHFEEVEVDVAYRTRTGDYEASEIAKRIGLPVLTRRCFPHPNWAHVADAGLFGNQSSYNNQDATFLHLSCDDDDDAGGSAGLGGGRNPSRRGALGWGWAPAQWQSDVGSAVVVRADGKPLSARHAEALCLYCRYDARDWMAHSMGEYAPDEPLARDLVLRMICRQTFSICWYRMCKDKHEKGEKVDAPFPYDV